MSNKTKVHFTLSDEAIQVINRRAQSPNKRGDWLSAAIVEYDALRPETMTGDGAVALLRRIATLLAFPDRD